MKAYGGVCALQPRVRLSVSAAVFGTLFAALGCSGDAESDDGARRVAERLVGGQRITTVNEVAAVGYAEAPAGAEANPSDPTLAATFNGTGVLLDPEVVLTAAHVADTVNAENLVFLESGDAIVDAAWVRTKLLHPTYFTSAERIALGMNDPDDPDTYASLSQIGLDVAAVFLKTPMAAPPGVSLPRAIAPNPMSLVGQTDAFSMYSYMLDTSRGLLNRGFLTAREVHPIVSLPYGAAHVVGLQFVSTTGPGVSCQKGDSGSGLFVGSSGSTRPLASINFASSISYLGGTRACLSVILDDAPGLSTLSLDSWIDAAKRTEGRVRYAYVGRKTGFFELDEETAARRKDRRDQLFYYREGSACFQHTEFGEGGRTRHLLDALDLRCPSDASQAVFDDFRGDIGDDGAFLVEGSLLALYGPGRDEEPAVTDLGGNYLGMSVVQSNNDPHADLLLTDTSGAAVTFFGSRHGLVGPYASEALESCWADSQFFGTACGARAFNGDCWCDAACSSRGDCCSDAPAACEDNAGHRVDPVVAAMQAGPTPPLKQESRLQALVTVNGTGGDGLGVFLDRSWILTAKELVAGSAGPGDVQVAHGGQALSIDQVLLSPDGRVALLHVPPWAAVNGLPAGHRLPFYSGSRTELELEPQLFHYHDGTSTEANVKIFDQRSSLVVGRPGSRFDKTHLLLEVIPADQVDADFARLGAPVMTFGQELVGITVARQRETTTWDAGAVGSSVIISEQADFSHASPTSDLSRSDLHWIRQVQTKAQLSSRDGAASGAGVWALNVSATASGQPDNSVAHFPISQLELGSPSASLASINQLGDWRFVGIGMLGTDIRAAVWHERALGQVVLWELDGLTVQGRARFFVDPSWHLAALGDIDGDGIDDLIWENGDFGLRFFWLINGLEQFSDTADLEQNPTRLLKYGQWFSGPSSTTDAGSVSLVAADSFYVASSANKTRTAADQAAANTLWRADSGELWVAEMSVQIMPCAELTDPLVLSTCRGLGASVLTYSIASDLMSVAQVEPYWHVGGTLDLNGDGRSDVLLHARGDGAPPEERGSLLALLSSAEGRWSASPVLASGAGNASIDPDAYRLAGGAK